LRLKLTADRGITLADASVLGDCLAVAACSEAWRKRHRLGLADGIFAALSLASLLPILIARYALSEDYPNYLAQLFILTAPAGHPVHHYYLAHWQPLADLGVWLVALPLAAISSPEIAMKTVWALGVAGLAGAIWCLHRALHVRSQPTLPLAALILFNLPLSVGLFNYLLGTVVALFGIALWLSWKKRLTPARLIAFNLLAGLTMVCHIAAAAALGLTVFALHAGRGRTLDRRGLAATAAGFVLPAAWLAIVALAHPMISQTGGTAGVSYSLLTKLQLLGAPFFSGVVPADILAATIWLAAIPLVLLRAGGRCHPRLIVPLALWTLTILALPNAVGNAYYLDLRLTIFPAALLIAALAVPPQRQATTMLFAAAILGVLIRVGLMLPAWRAHDQHVESFLAATQTLPLGAKVLTVQAPQIEHAWRCIVPFHWPPLDEHIPTLLVATHAAFVSTVFADPNLQPVEPAAAVRDLAKPAPQAIPWFMLRAGERAERDAAFARQLPPEFWYYVPHAWRRRYDYLAVLHTGCSGEIAPLIGLTPVGESQTYRLYRSAPPRP
jgi:hypothetical protein